MAIPLSEKYRPKDLDHVLGNEEIIKCLKSLNSDNLPNLLFYGPPGTGKTTTIRCLLNGNIKKGDENNLKDKNNKISRNRILELNASDERGINIVRERIKEFASIKTKNFVILDEVDSMTKDAQGALRRIIEDFSEKTRFCLICNYPKNIIEPIKSRCTKFRFSPVKINILKIKEICQNEGIFLGPSRNNLDKNTDTEREQEIKNNEENELELDGLKMLIDHSDGDMRKLMNNLQGIKATHYFSGINCNSVTEFLGIPKQKDILEIFDNLINKNINFVDSYKFIMKRFIDLEMDGLIDGLYKLILKGPNENTTENGQMKTTPSGIKNKLYYCYELAKIERRLSIGCLDKIQLKSLIGIFKNN